MRDFYKRVIGVVGALFILGSGVACGKKAPEPEATPLDQQVLTQGLETLKKEDGTVLFDGLEQPGEEQLLELYGLDVTPCSSYFVWFDKEYRFVLLLQPEDGKSNDVKNSVNSALNELATQLALYSPEQSAAVENRMETMRGDYLIYIACEKNELVLAEIEKAL